MAEQLELPLWNTPEDEPRVRERSVILRKAEEYVTKQRAQDYGDMSINFAVIGKYWSTHLGIEISSEDVAVMMALLKIARAKANPATEDSFIDGCGYLALAGELAKLKRELAELKNR